MSLVRGLVRGSKKLEILWRTEVCLGFLLLSACSSTLCNRTSRFEEVLEGELCVEEGRGRGVVIGLKPYSRVLGGWNFPLAVWNVIGRLVKMCCNMPSGFCPDPGTANACNWVMEGAGGCRPEEPRIGSCDLGFLVEAVTIEATGGRETVG